MGSDGDRKFKLLIRRCGGVANRDERNKFRSRPEPANADCTCSRNQNVQFRENSLLSATSQVNMGKAKKTRKFAATKRLLNAKNDTRLKAVKANLPKSEDKQKTDGELVREMFSSFDRC
jgi:hypothetical protein